MTALVLVLGAVVVGAAAGYGVMRARRPSRDATRLSTTRQILLPFTGTTVSRRALDAALRLARVEEATLMPAFLATVPRTLPLDSPLPRQCTIGMPLLEAIEQRAAAQHIPVDARIERGRTYRHALARLLETERFDRVIVSAASDTRLGIPGDDILWILENAQAEVLILRPAPEDTRAISATGIHGHF